MPQKSPNPPPRHRLLTVKEFCAGLADGGLQVAPRTVYEWLESGQVTACRIGMGRGRWRVHPGAVFEVLERHRQAEVLAALEMSTPTSEVG